MFPVVPVLLSVTQKKELPPAEAAPLLVYFLSLVYHIHIFTIEKMLEHFPRFLIWVDKLHNAEKKKRESLSLSNRSGLKKKSEAQLEKCTSWRDISNNTGHHPVERLMIDTEGQRVNNSS